MWDKLISKGIEIIFISTSKKTFDALWSSIPNLPKKIKAWWQGKTIAIIGPTACGKNSFFNRLKKEEIPESHIQTRGTEKVKTFKISWNLPQEGKVEFSCKNSINVGGETDERERYWLDACKDAEVIFYLVDAKKLNSDRTACLDRVKSDFRWMASNVNKFEKGPRIHILLNKMDTLVDPLHPALKQIEELISSKKEGNKQIDATEIETIAREILGTNAEKISGPTPISMTSNEIFNHSFNLALASVIQSLVD